MSILSTLERYYDAVPRPLATTESIGPFTLFVRTTPEGWPYYARPSLGVASPLAAAHVAAVRERQRELGVPESLEWVHETTPTLLTAARDAGMHVRECPLLVLPHGAATVTPPLPDGCTVSLLAAASPDLAPVLAAVAAGFEDSDDLQVGSAGVLPDLISAGLMATAGAFDSDGAVGGGSHSPRGETTELTGIAVIPRARRRGLGAAVTAALVADAHARGVSTVFLSAGDGAVARVYERVGFRRVGTACVAGAPKV